MTNQDLQRCWILAVLMLMLSLQVHVYVAETGYDPDKISFAMYISEAFGFVGSLFTLFLTGATANRLIDHAAKVWAKRERKR